jgi:hypothetical protein
MSIHGTAVRNDVGNLQASAAVMFGPKSKMKGISALPTTRVEKFGKYVT